MPFHSTGLPDLLVFDPVVYKDDRGFFFEAYNQQAFEQQGIRTRFLQDNQSFSAKNVIRGLHFQKPPHAQAKLIRVLNGTILDVAVDIRKGSPAYGKSFCIELSAENRRQLFIPRGFAHGFAVLSDGADVLYKCDAFYSKESDGGICYNDPALDIDWRVPPEKAILSAKDQSLPLLADFQNEFVYPAR